MKTRNILKAMIDICTILIEKKLSFFAQLKRAKVNKDFTFKRLFNFNAFKITSNHQKSPQT